jgi:hypothetical protein
MRSFSFQAEMLTLVGAVRYAVGEQSDTVGSQSGRREISKRTDMILQDDLQGAVASIPALIYTDGNPVSMVFVNL